MNLLKNIKVSLLKVSMSFAMLGLFTLFMPAVSYAALAQGQPTPGAGAGSGSSAIQQEVCDGIGGCDTGGTGRNTGLNKVVNFAINLMIVLLAVISTIMIILGGIKYASSGGDSNATASAKNTIIYALIGLVIAVLAKPLIDLVLKAL